MERGLLSSLVLVRRSLPWDSSAYSIKIGWPTWQKMGRKKPGLEAKLPSAKIGAADITISSSASTMQMGKSSGACTRTRIRPRASRSVSGGRRWWSPPALPRSPDYCRLRGRFALRWHGRGRLVAAARSCYKKKVVERP